MAQDATKIHQGPLRVFVGGTNPTTGTPPTLSTHTAGVPAGYTEIGYTQGDTTVEAVIEKNEIMAEQAFGIVAVYTTKEGIRVTGSMLERNYAALKVALDEAIASVDDGSKTLHYFGGGTTVLTPKTQSVVLTAIQPVAPTKFFVCTIYKAYTKKGFSMAFNKQKESLIAFELVGIVDSSRNAGDQISQMFWEK